MTFCSHDMIRNYLHTHRERDIHTHTNKMKDTETEKMRQWERTGTEREREREREIERERERESTYMIIYKVTSNECDMTRNGIRMHGTQTHSPSSKTPQSAIIHELTAR